MKISQSLSRNEWTAILTACGLLYLLGVMNLLLERWWLNAWSITWLLIGLVPYAVIILFLSLVALLLDRARRAYGWDSTRPSVRILRTGVLFATAFLSGLLGQVAFNVALNLTGRIQVDIFRVYPTELIAGITAGIVILVLMWAYGTQRRFIVAVGVLGAALYVLPSVVPGSLQRDLEAGWIDVLNSTNPDPAYVPDTSVVVIHLDSWTGAEDMRSLFRLIARSGPSAIGIMFPVYTFVDAGKDPTMYAILPKERTVFGVFPYGKDRDTPDTWNRLERVTDVRSGSASGVNSEEKWFLPRGTYLPVIQQDSLLRFSHRACDAGLALALIHRNADLPLPIERVSSLLFGETIRIDGLSIPTTSTGAAIVNRFRDESVWGQAVLKAEQREMPFGGGVALYLHPHGLQGSDGYVMPKRMADGSEDVAFGVPGPYAASTDTDHIPGLRGRIVLITMRSQHDVPKILPQHMEAAEDAAGTSYNAIIKGLLVVDPIRSLNDTISSILFLLMMLLVLWLFRRHRPFRAAVQVTMITIAALLIGVILFGVADVHIPGSPVLIPAGLGLIILFPAELARERRLIQAERARLSSELKTAHDMQMGLMPKEDPVIPGLDISASCVPASEVGGDFYDFVWLDRRHTKLGIAVADVSGKAMKAAMTAVMTSGMLSSEVQKSSSPREVLRRINHPLYIRSDRRVFTALAFAVINTKDKTLTYSSAGQTPPALVRRARIQDLKIQGVRLPLGVKEDVIYKELKLVLQKGDVLVLSTDGIVEAMNAKKELYGFERFHAALEKWHDLPATAIRDRLLADVKEFAGTTAQYDDMTVVIVKIM